MLDLEIATPPSVDGLDIVSLVEMKQHLRIVASTWDADIEEAIKDVAAKQQAPLGDLNRTIFPTQWRFFRKSFPTGRVIRLPYPPLLTVDSIYYESGDSPTPSLSPSTYIVRRGDGTVPGEIELLSTERWPLLADPHPRGIQILFTAGYDGTIFDYPRQLKRLIKLLAGHYLENREGTVADVARGLLISRKIEFGVEELRQSLRVSPDMGDWEADNDIKAVAE